MVEQLSGIGESMHDRAQQQKLLIARRLYHLIREGVFLRTEVRRARHGALTEGCDSIIALGRLQDAAKEWVYLEPDGAMKVGQSYATAAVTAGSPGLDLRQGRLLSDLEYLAWAPAALAAIQDRLKDATRSEISS